MGPPPGAINGNEGMKTIAPLLIAAALIAVKALAQGPANPALAAGPWPIFHANSSCTASIQLPGSWKADRPEWVPNLKHRRFTRISVSPWTVIPKPLPNGDQIIFTNPVEGVAKYAIRNGRLEPVGLLPLDRDTRDFDWNVAILRDGSVLVTEIRRNGFAIVGQQVPGVDAPPVLLRRFSLPRDFGTISTHFNVAFDGTILVLTQEAFLLAVNPRDGRVRAWLDLRGYDYVAHNGFPVDEKGRIYLIAQDAMLAIDWNGTRLSKAWEAFYDSRGPGFQSRGNRGRLRERLAVIRGQPGTGSGTTPTLLGTPGTGIAVVVDGHRPQNRLVAFWRGRIPADWVPLRDPTNPAVTLDRRIAGILVLPHSTPDGEGFSAENSPAAFGNSLVVAQWAGFRPDATPPRGVQRVDWSPATRRLSLVWTNPWIHFNGVPTIVSAANGRFTMGMGRDRDRHVYSVLNFSTGQLVSQLDLGADDSVLDQGNGHAVASDGSIIYGGKEKLVRITPGTGIPR